MRGQLPELPEWEGAVPDGAVPDGAVVDGVVVDGVVAVDVAVVPVVPEPVAAFAIATTPPARAPVQASVASSFLVCVLMLDLLSASCVLRLLRPWIPVKSCRL
jgi:hypothetical protein